MSPETLASIGVSLITAVCGVWAARVARRTPRQERRDDFVAVSEQQGKAIERLEGRIQRQETEGERQRERIAAQDTTIAYLHTWVRLLAGHIRSLGHEPPLAPQPVPAEVRQLLRDIDV
ncbi:hypothetical protein [Streptomyces albireticuli]|uniref:Uncharacterized protein n=1 Tax=Streptomyces albireticuli TaxID=1940 RepID=A0A2A2D4A2_9ACTN|nr:hypothetical protein [Streptomyces albireticuli]MCD9196088.1 hypothetical protein [Streptomyces albireticuli]PAU46160.1 hypothetical protein CK936_25525 [Streptomyces albireticuli]